jgi:hypothetical protein
MEPVRHGPLRALARAARRSFYRLRARGVPVVYDVRYQRGVYGVPIDPLRGDKVLGALEDAGLVHPGLLSEPRPLAPGTDGPHLGGALALLPDCERIESGWWDGAGIARDYFVAEDSAGARYWVYRERASGQWLLHGVFG